jgi:hypothetical protein
MPVPVSAIETHHTAIVSKNGTYNENARAIDGRHRLYRIGDQIEEHLLQLNSISGHPELPRTSVNFDQYVVAVQIVLEQRDRFFDAIAEIERNSDGGILPEVRPDAFDDRSRAMPISGDVRELRFRLVEVGNGAIQPAQASVRSRHHSRERLLNLVRDRRRNSVAGH